MKKVLAMICLVITILCFLQFVLLAYECIATYLHLREMNASGSEYFFFLIAPCMFAAIAVVGVVAYGLYRKLTVNRFEIGAIAFAILAVGLLLLFGMLVMMVL